MSIRNSPRPLGGFSREEAIDAFLSACKRPSPDTLFITDSWIEPRLKRLREHLSNPITPEQADALCDAIEKRVKLDTVIDWLASCDTCPWSLFLEKRTKWQMDREASEREQAERRRQQMIEDGRRKQMANIGTFEGGVIAGCPVAFIPDSVRLYPDFLTWWMEVGRKNPHDPQGWTSIKGPWVMVGRSEMVAPDVWNALPIAERKLIEEWARTIPIGIYFD